MTFAGDPTRDTGPTPLQFDEREEKEETRMRDEGRTGLFVELQLTPAHRNGT